MPYFNYHATVKRLIKENKLIRYEISETINNATTLILYFNDIKHPVMKIKTERIPEYLNLLSHDDSKEKTKNQR